MTIYTTLYAIISLIGLAGILAAAAREFCSIEDKWALSTPPALRGVEPRRCTRKFQSVS